MNNPIASDRLNYDVLFHTDLSRTGGTSNGLDLDRLNWGNYDLVVIDESHNFRNGAGTHANTQENRYVKLMDKVIRAVVKTKVLMLSATPVNNRFNDLKNQLALAYEGDTELMDKQLNTSKTLDEIFRQAQTAFNAWSKLDMEQRTTDALLKMLDSVTAVSRTVLRRLMLEKSSSFLLRIPELRLFRMNFRDGVSDF